MFNTVFALEAAASGAAENTNAGGGGWMSWIVPLVMIGAIVLMFVFSSRSQKKRDKEITDMRNSLRVGDEVTTNGGMSISSTCENPELVCQWQNYFWTTEGALMVNYGVDGESLTYEGEEPRFDWQTPVTALDQHAPNADMALELFTMKRFATSYMDHDRLLPTFSDVALNAVELWTMENSVNERNLPATLTSTFTVEEDEEIGEYESDMLTYASEHALKFLDGSWELNDANWQEYVDTINSMGMPEIIAVYQNAYDEMMAGER